MAESLLHSVYVLRLLVEPDGESMAEVMDGVPFSELPLGMELPGQVSEVIGPSAIALRAEPIALRQSLQPCTSPDTSWPMLPALS